MPGKFVVEYAIYTPQQIVKPDRFNRKKSFPTLKGAFGFWYRKYVENHGVAHIWHGKNRANGVDIMNIIRNKGDLDKFLETRLKLKV